MSRLKGLFGVLATVSLVVCAAGTQAKEMVSVERPVVNMRSGSSTKHSILWALSKGYPLEVMRHQGNWLQVRDFENDKGWVYRPMVGKKAHVIVKSPVVNVRSAPSTSSRVLGRAEYGEVLRTLENKNQWVKVERDSGTKGWVSRGLVWGW